MILKSKYFDKIEAKEDEIIYFKEGLYGFEYIKQFVLLGNADNIENPFKWLHAVDYEDVCFAVVNPEMLINGYIKNHTADLIDKVFVEKEDDLLVYCIVVVAKNPKDSTVNIKSPVVINKKNRIGKQVILDNCNYSIKQKLVSYNP